MTFSYLLDEKSYPGEKMPHAAMYPHPSRSDGFVVANFLAERDGHPVLNIQNNARFTLSKDDDGGLSFEDPPLGGTWPQEHLSSAIKRIEK